MLNRKTAKDFAASGYVVRPAQNGGFCVDMGAFEDRHMLREFACFTNSQDLVAFLSKGHAEYDKEIAA